MSKIKFNKKDFKLFLDSLSRVSDTAIVNLEDDSMYAISSSEDRSLFLYCKLECDNDTVTKLNLPSLKKLSKSLDLVPDDIVEFKLNNNNLEYSGKKVKFKYHLFGDGILVAPKITLTKIESLKYDYHFLADKELILSILKNSSIFKDTNKLYIYTEDGHLIWSLGDKTMTNSDVFTMIGDKVDFDMKEQFIINLDNLRLLAFKNADVFKFSITNMGIGSISLKNEDIELNYILSGLTN